MAHWRTELEALVSETMAFVDANRSQKPAASIVALSPAKPRSESTSEQPPARNDVPTAWETYQLSVMTLTGGSEISGLISRG
jgi:hypothetical protein